MKKLTFTSVLLCALLMCLAQPTLELNVELLSDNEMAQPWGMSFISESELLFTEKSGKLYKYNIDTDTKTEITGLPSIAVVGQGGLLDVAIHPAFATNQLVYLSYSKSVNGGYTLAIGRGTLVGSQLSNFEEIFEALPYKSGTNHFGSRITFDDNNYLYFSSSERQEQDNAQLLSNHLGKVIRLNDDGAVPTDNPFVNKVDTMPEIYSYGHRNIQGMVYHKKSGKLYAHEHGPRGGDELNVIEASKNYGWPSITFGVNYNGTVISEDTAREGMEQPIRYWVPSIAPCGMAIVPLENEESGEVNFIIGALAGRQIQWVNIKDDKHIATYSFMQNYARFRDVEVAPDGEIYALTESPNSLIRLKTNQIVLGRDKNELLSDNVFPNPTSGKFVISLEEINSKNLEVLIYNTNGKSINAPTNVSSSSLEIDLSTQANGIYTIKLITNETAYNYRVVKE